MANRPETVQKPLAGRPRDGGSPCRPWQRVRVGLARVERVAHLRCMTASITPRGGFEPLISIGDLSDPIGCRSS